MFSEINNNNSFISSLSSMGGSSPTILVQLPHPPPPPGLLVAQGLVPLFVVGLLPVKLYELPIGTEIVYPR
jgi:hypothetical protein